MGLITQPTALGHMVKLVCISLCLKYETRSTKSLRVAGFLALFCHLKQKRQPFTEISWLTIMGREAAMVHVSEKWLVLTAGTMKITQHRAFLPEL